jgi:hypothetical protein
VCVFIDHSVRQLPGRVYTLAVDWAPEDKTPLLLLLPVGDGGGEGFCLQDAIRKQLQSRTE